MTQKVDEFLAHFGVKGMQWGVRKNVSVVGKSSLSHPINGPGQIPSVRTTSSSSNITPATPKEHEETARATMVTTRAMLISNREEVSAVMNKVDSKYDPMKLGLNPDSVRKYDHDMSLALTKVAQKITPKGFKAFVRVDGETTDLYVGSSQWMKEAYKGPIYHSAISNISGAHSRLRVIRDKQGMITGFATLKKGRN